MNGRWYSAGSFGRSRGCICRIHPPKRQEVAVRASVLAIFGGVFVANARYLGVSIGGVTGEPVVDATATPGTFIGLAHFVSPGMKDQRRGFIKGKAWLWLDETKRAHCGRVRRFEFRNGNISCGGCERRWRS